MAANAHLKELTNKHSNLDQQIKRELKSPQPDTILLSKLKKQKLFLKDRIAASD